MPTTIDVFTSPMMRVPFRPNTFDVDVLPDVAILEVVRLLEETVPVTVMSPDVAILEVVRLLDDTVA